LPVSPPLNTNLRSRVFELRARAALNARFDSADYGVSSMTATGALCSKWYCCSCGVRTSLYRLKGTHIELGSWTGSFIKLSLMSCTSWTNISLIFYVDIEWWHAKPTSFPVL
jgi:hypothetical protein